MILKILCVLVCLGSATRFAYCEERLAVPRITEISLSRAGDREGTGPEDVLTLRDDGVAVYVGTKVNDLCPGLDHTLWAFEMAVRGVASDIQWEKSIRTDAHSVEPQRNRLMDEANPPKVELMAWGEEIAGVRTGLGFQANTKTGKHIFAMGEPIKLVVKLRNTGKTVAKRSYSEGTYYDQVPTVLDEAGNPLTVIRHSMRAGLWRLINYSLAPGEELTISKPEVVFVAADSAYHHGLRLDPTDDCSRCGFRCASPGQPK